MKPIERAPSELLTVDDAAERVGVSAATIRRMCVSGQLASYKIGRAWLIPEDALTSLRAMASDSDVEQLVDLPAALESVRGWDLKRDLWRPDALDFADSIQSPDTLYAEVLSRLHGDIPHEVAQRTQFPKSPVLFRNAADLSLADRVAYEAVVAAMAPLLDARLTVAVFNNRLSDRVNRRAGVTSAWQAFTEAVRDAVNLSPSWLVKSDIAAFFEFVNHRALLDRVSALGVNPNLVKSLRAMLTIWAVRPGFGLPQGPDASRLLANFFLAELDEVIQDIEGVSYFRFMDDIRIVAKTRATAVTALTAFAKQLERLGLPISSSKTDAYDPAKAMSEVEEDDLRGATYQVAFDEDDELGLATVVESSLADMFKEACEMPGQLDKRRATYSLYRLADGEDAGIVELILDRLEDFAPIAHLAVRYLGPRLDDGDVIRRIFDYIEDRDRNVSEYLEHWLLAGLIDTGEPMSPDIYRILRVRFSDRNLSSALRGTIASLISTSGRDGDIRLIEDELAATSEMQYARQLIVALNRAARLSASTRSRVLQRFPGLQLTMDYMIGRKVLPRISPVREAERADSQRFEAPLSVVDSNADFT